MNEWNLFQIGNIESIMATGYIFFCSLLIQNIRYQIYEQEFISASRLASLFWLYKVQDFCNALLGLLVIIFMKNDDIFCFYTCHQIGILQIYPFGFRPSSKWVTWWLKYLVGDAEISSTANVTWDILSENSSKSPDLKFKVQPGRKHVIFTFLQWLSRDALVWCLF